MPDRVEVPVAWEILYHHSGWDGFQVLDAGVRVFSSAYRSAELVSMKDMDDPRGPIFVFAVERL